MTSKKKGNVIEKISDLLEENLPEVDIEKTGKEYIERLDEEELNKIRSKCDTLHFVKLLKLDSQRADRSVAGGKTIPSHKPVGVVLYSDEDIEVPDIPGEYNKRTGIPADEIGSKKVKKNENFWLTYYEFMFLMFRPEYAGFLTRDEDKDPFGVYFSARMPKFLNSEYKLPTPTIRFRSEGSPKETMEAVDYLDKETNTWHVKEEYKEKFASYLPMITPKRNKSDKKFPTSTNKTLGLSRVLKQKYNYDIE